DDDLNISAALGFLFDTIRDTNRALDQGKLTPEEASEWLEWWKRIDTVLALTVEESGPPAEVTKLADERAQARLAKDWRKSDELRDQIAALGWDVRDTKDGQKVTRRAGT
ncbi:MAG TPA: DALR domain-containing protein, partial [Chthoniobacterales bacterium]|nr:DALR domain-containing protein [Chthoniobacterales bacterium]